MKITVVGVGNVGSAVCQRIINGGIATELVMIDAIEGLAKGKALDLKHSTPIDGETKIKGTTNYKHTKNSDITIITAGKPRKEGMTRADLAKENSQIIREISRKISRYSPESKIIVVTNPLDPLTWQAYKSTGFPRNRVMGMAGELDTSRYRKLISSEIGISPQDIDGLVIGPHNESMIPLTENTSVRGIPIEKFLTEKQIEKITRQTRDSGKKIVEHLQNGSAYHAPSAAIYRMIRAIARDEKKLMSVSTVLQGEYGIEETAIGVPVVIGSDGIESIPEKLGEKNIQRLQEAAEGIKRTINQIQ
ncbi:malate dehydrogenase [Methanonatronarchaeum sp. AMET6-2]|uniref:malate dehydrogenase n=1 Tax=Methanonatronarchaeum sp. AMET6-2 TaxID=2933293 RepID=UPI001215547C|nr:malate dehydrogenase [Methanonatronarchaeum sp. AMET6-2]RZN60989.1 MAG: malate dehydrogenase [Methanonatronarchaeia archaeon]UOY10683.1 malate dehydrogenase [Methanonatronarchaeum sp. AMET6-2]